MAYSRIFKSVISRCNADSLISFSSPPFVLNFRIKCLCSTSETITDEVISPLITVGRKSSYLVLKSFILRMRFGNNDMSEFPYRECSERARDSADLAKYANDVFVEYKASRYCDLTEFVVLEMFS